MLSRVLRSGLRAAVVAVGVALLARVLMRLVALDTLGSGRFSPAGTLGILVLFVLSAVGAAVGRALTDRWAVLVPVVLATSALLWEGDVAIGMSSFSDARAEPMTGLRWIGFWALFAAISTLAALTPLVGLRAAQGRASGPAGRAGQPLPNDAA